MTKRSDLILMEDMLDNAQDAMTFTKGLTRDSFVTNRLVVSATLRSIQVIGEAASRISLEYRDKHPFIPWKQIIGTRNILVHQYFELDNDAVWKIIEVDLPQLIKNILQILRSP